MLHLKVTLLAIGLALTTGCLAGSGDGTQLPKYNEDRTTKYQTGQSFVTETKSSKTICRVYRSLDSIENVSKWYQGKLSGIEGLRGPVQMGGHKLVWSNGNINFIEGPMYDFKPINPNKIGMMVLLDRYQEGGATPGEGITIFYLVRSEPEDKPAEPAKKK